MPYTIDKYRLLQKRAKYISGFTNTDNVYFSNKGLLSDKILINNREYRIVVTKYLIKKDLFDAKNITLIGIDLFKTSKFSSILSEPKYFVETLILLSDYLGWYKELKELKNILNNNKWGFIFKDDLLLTTFYNKYKDLITELLLIASRFKVDFGGKPRIRNIYNYHSDKHKLDWIMNNDIDKNIAMIKLQTMIGNININSNERFCK